MREGGDVPAGRAEAELRRRRIAGRGEKQEKATAETPGQVRLCQGYDELDEIEAATSSGPQQLRQRRAVTHGGDGQSRDQEREQRKRGANWWRRSSRHNDAKGC
ncbi:hypothetical protein NL676_007720 [Syzygium grande]|nr:hypothetical protein NL676_007720 [Syzygium grande]